MLAVKGEQSTVAYIEEPSFEPGWNRVAELDYLGSGCFKDSASAERAPLER